MSANSRLICEDTVSELYDFLRKEHRDIEAMEERLSRATWIFPLSILQSLLLALGFQSELQSLREDLQRRRGRFLAQVRSRFQGYLGDCTRRFVRYEDLDGVRTVRLELRRWYKRYEKHAPDNVLKQWKHLWEATRDLDDWRKKVNRKFIEDEKRALKSYFDTVESNPLTETQKEAVIVDEANNLVLAGAGSGKTSVIVARIGYLLRKGYSSANRILILAYNKKAQLELAERIEEKLGATVDTKTFHALGLHIVSEGRGIRPNLCKWAEDEAQAAPLVRGIVEELTESDREFYRDISRYFASYFAPYRTREEFETPADYYNYLRSHDIRTFKGERVKSFEECEIANQLYLWGVEYRYEAPYEHETGTKRHRQYHPDFYLPEYGIYLEHFGISRDGKTREDIDSDRYLEGMEWKRALHRSKGTRLIETYSYEKREGVLLKKLRDKLEAAGVVIAERPISEALETFNKSGRMDLFTKLFLTFKGHFKSNAMNLDGLWSSLGAGEERQRAFLRVFEKVYRSYEAKKRECDCIDFDDMIALACETVEEGRFRSRYDYILVDEFQDISAGRSRLVQALRKQVERSAITVVGDDWQSINRFAGSDIGIIRNFESVFGEAETVRLDYTFRFPEEVSRVATEFIQKNPLQLKKVIKTLKRNDAPGVYLFWYANEEEETKRVESILSMIDKNEGSGRKCIMFLARYRFEKPKKFSYWQSLYRDRFDLGFSTVHAAKGLEADYVVLLDLKSGRYGFPSEIDDDPLLDMVMPHSESYANAEERRLFYVALTRTRKKIFVLAHKTEVSSFAQELLDEFGEMIYQVGYDKAEIQHCPRCRKGILVKRRSKDRHWFYGCSNFPYCDYTEPLMTCPKCERFEVVKDRSTHIARCKDPSCDGYIKLCKKCDNYMVLRNGKYGQFLGCMSYPECTYTENLHQEHR